MNHLIFVWTATMFLASGAPSDFTVAAATARQSTVRISTWNQGRPKPTVAALLPGESDPFDGVGSGVIWRADMERRMLLIITNHHVAFGARRIRIRLHDRREYDGELIGTDAVSEVAVVRVDIAEGPMPTPIVPRDSDTVRVGEWAVAVGCPLAQDFSVSVGVVSAIGRRPKLKSHAAGKEQAELEDYLQTDASINPGNSGGALVDSDGKLVGMNTAILGKSGSIGIGFAIPSNIALDIADRLVSNGGHAWHGFLGVKLKETSKSTVVIQQVLLATPASPLLAGDTILSVDGVEISDARSLRRLVDGKKPGTTVLATVKRGDENKTVAITVHDLEQVRDRP